MQTWLRRKAEAFVSMRPACAWTRIDRSRSRFVGDYIGVSSHDTNPSRLGSEGLRSRSSTITGQHAANSTLDHDKLLSSRISLGCSSAPLGDDHVSGPRPLSRSVIRRRAGA
jgi:hypothetical protein